MAIAEMHRVFVLTVIERGEIKDQQVVVDSAEMMRIYKEEVKKSKLRTFGGDLFFESVRTLGVGHSSSVETTEKQITVRRCLVR